MGSRTRRWAALRIAITVGGAAALTMLAGAVIPTPEAAAIGPALTESEVLELISRCEFYAKRVKPKRDLTIAVVDPEGNSLGVYQTGGPNIGGGRVAVALAKAATATYFSSDFGSFTTRTAAFIIQDHYPPGVRFAPGGPLYGVQFSSFIGTDVNQIFFPGPRNVLEAVETRVRGDLGGVALYKNGSRVGGLGVDDGAASARVSIPNKIIFGGKCRKNYRLTFRNLRKGRHLERVVHQAASDYVAQPSERAGRITVDGIRLPFRGPTRLRERPAPLVNASPDEASFDPDVHTGSFADTYPLRGAAGIPSRFSDFTLPPPPGAGANAQDFRGQIPIKFPIRASTDGNLTQADVERILWQGAQRANIVRAAIRRPIGRAMECWISVVDTRGEVLGVFRFAPDATMFSYDVSVQKARTALFFSDRQAAWSCRALGQFAQAFYPAGQQSAAQGPLYQLQDGLTVAKIAGAFEGADSEIDIIRNGITIFPGGVPLYNKSGEIIGAVGVSGDGVDQDDIVSDFASRGFGAPKPIRCDALGGPKLKASLMRSLRRLQAAAPPDPGPDSCSTDDVARLGLAFFHARLNRCIKRLKKLDVEVGPPYVKHPRHPGPVTVR